MGAATVAVLMAGCGGGANLASQVDRPGFVAGDGTIEQVPLDRRPTPLTTTGVTLDGRPWSIADERGRVVVLHVWGSWCAPCVEEMPRLERVWQRLRGASRPVSLMGIATRESPQTASAFVRKTRLTFPSLADRDGQAVLSLQGKAEATPTTLVVDRQGRIAGRVSGPITESTLSAVIDDVVAEHG